MGEDFRREAVLFLRDVAGLFKQRQVDVGLDVALGARIAVPIPRAAEVAALLDHAKVRNARFAQSGTGQEAAETAADDDDIHIVRQRFALKTRRYVGVVDEMGELAVHFNVLFVAVLAQAFVALLAVLAAQCVRVEIELLLSVCFCHVAILVCGRVAVEAAIVPKLH